MKNYLSIIGTSKIIEKHIYAAKKNKFKINSIISLNKNAHKNLSYIKNKFKIKKIYNDLDKFLIDAKNNKSSILIASRIIDNEKVLNKVLKYDLKILIEKPVFLNLIKYKKFINHKKNIFIGYNRIYFKFVEYIKRLRNQEKIFFINITCPETNKIDFLKNSCHSISIIHYIFGKLYFLKKISNKKHFLIIYRTKKNEIIYFNFELDSPKNFSIEFSLKNKILLAKPIEQFFKIEKIKKKIIKKENFYFPVQKLIYDENKFDGKPGFVEQYKNFKLFLKNKKAKYLNIEDAKSIMEIANKVYSDVR